MSIAEGPRDRADGTASPAHAGEAVAERPSGRSEQERESQPCGATVLHQSAHALANPYCYFLDDDAFVETARPGFRHRVITGEHLQLCFWRIAGGAAGSVLHNHTENEQLGIIMKGKLDFRIGPEGANDERIVLSEGDSYLAPRSVWHGDSVFIGDDTYGECWILDVFAPPRTDLATTG